MVNVNELLQKVIDVAGSDLHLKADSRPMIRIVGELEPQDFDVLSQEDMVHILKEIATEEQFEAFEENWELDFGITFNDTFRFRVNVYKNIGKIGMALRLLRNDILNFEELGLPEVLLNVCKERRGLILVTGITGSGKSTTLATMINQINETRKGHIITIEDPIEFIHPNKKSIVTQREMGSDSKNFRELLRHALRQDPDVVQIGEMRDAVTIQTAISAAETGHLVLSTLHTVKAPPTVERILSFFEGPEQTIVRTQLALNLRAVISQRLIPSKDGTRIVPAVEVLINTTTARKFILEGRINELNQVMQNGEEGMQTFDQCLADLVRNGQISMEEGMAASDSPLTLRRDVMGGVSGGDRSAIIGGF